jgi:hypothetical protein
MHINLPKWGKTYNNNNNANICSFKSMQSVYCTVAK